MKQKIGKWMQGQIMLMAIIFILDYIGLSLVGIPYALPLAAFAGLLEIVPYVGPIISAVPGVVLGFLVSPIKGLLALIIYIITQQAESNIVTPLIMKRTVDLNPVVVILALLIGAKLGGILGAILAIPVATTIGIIAKDMMAKDIKKAGTEAGV
jgi:predicted PurR-regulated permease PerM